MVYCLKYFRQFDSFFVVDFIIFLGYGAIKISISYKNIAVCINLFKF